MLRLVPRTEQSLLAQILVPLTAIGLTLIAGAIMFTLLGKSPLDAFYAFFIEPLTTRYGIGEVLLKTGPLLLIAQGLAIGFRARVWNIGAEGQLLLGAIASGSIALHFNDTDSIWLLPGMIIAGTLAGAAWAAIAAWLRTSFNANEILVTFMLSSIALQLLYYLVTGPLRDPMGMNFPQSALFEDAALFDPLISGTRVNSSLYLALVATVVAWVFVQRSVPGYKLLVSGLAPRAARYAGFAENRAVWMGLLIGGAAAGMAGVGEVAGPLGLLQRNISPGYGFAAIIVAFLGGLHPIGIIFAAFFMALIYVGGDMSLVSVGIPNASTTLFQGMLLVFYLACYLFVHYRLKRIVAPATTPGNH
ncbi:sugar ABC transporter permease [Chromatiales bacterium (ex Bugula neritina AB1)]|nr:sugar ABC transporter permease [Chromatiales bacterium (ex Bugula neritina AB1)]